MREEQERITGAARREGPSVARGEGEPLPERADMLADGRTNPNADGDLSAPAHEADGARVYQGVRIVYEDNHILVVVKPPNMPSQSDPTGDLDVLSAMKLYLAEKYNKKGEVYLGLVHRLDRPVGGLMVLARTGKAADRLSAQVREKTLSRQYVAAVRGDAPQEAELTDWLLKNARTNMVRVVEPGTARAKEARLRFARVGSAKDLTLVRVRLFTGRSHQIRVQLSHAGMPIWGDARYGRGRPGEQIALWGMHLGLMHPTKRERMDFVAPPPRDGAPWRSFGEEIWEAEGKISL